MRGATSSYGDQLNHTVALTPHSMPHSVTAGQHATHHNLSPLNAKRPRGGGTPHKHYIPTASKRPRAKTEQPKTRAKTRAKTRGGGGRGTRDLRRRTRRHPLKRNATHPQPTTQKPHNDNAAERGPPPPAAPRQTTSEDPSEDPTHDTTTRPRGRGAPLFGALGPHQAPPTKKKRHPPPTNDPQSPKTTKPTAPKRGTPRPHPFYLGGTIFFLGGGGTSF